MDRWVSGLNPWIANPPTLNSVPGFQSSPLIEEFMSKSLKYVEARGLDMTLEIFQAQRMQEEP